MAKNATSDTARLDWLDKNAWGAGLINDDNGHWAVSFDGFQNVAMGKEPVDIQTTFFIKADFWKPTVREAIDAAMKEDADE